LAGETTIGRKLGEFRADFVKRKPYPLNKPTGEEQT
jgi:hypothetical protein